MNKDLERMHQRQQNMIHTFLNSDEGAEWHAHHDEVPQGGKVLIISKKGEDVPHDVLRDILAYQESEVLLGKDNLTRADCADVAVHFEDAFDKEPRFRPLRDRGYVVGRLVAKNVTGKPLAFFREKGYEYHLMNLLEYFPERGRPFHASLDLTAHYNMEIEKGTNDIFIVRANSREELLHVLQSITHVSWEARDE